MGAFLLACGVPPGVDAGAGDAGSDARAPLWQQLGCELASEEPEIGADRFCGAVHDYVREMPGAPWWYCGDAAAQPDGSADAGCSPADVGWSTVESCDAWVTCGAEPCYHCTDWTDNPGAF